VRLASKLGYDGFSELQDSIQRDLLAQLRPAAERIREQSGETGRSRHTAVQLANVQATLDAVDDAVLTAVVERLADLRAPVAVVSGDASIGVACVLSSQLGLLRPSVTLLSGNDVTMRREVGLLAPATTLIALDVRRYDRWLLDTVGAARDRRLAVVALTDSVLSPLASLARWTFVVSAGSLGPFDSHVGTLALVDLIVAEASGRLRRSATDRLDEVERAWRAGDSLVES
jgi:DNA-binding MurR/RpiR family transcriptional regulator